MEKISGDTIDALFAAGAYRKAVEMGMSEKDAESFTLEVCKQAASRKIVLDDEEDEEDTWWNRNKGWALPTLVGTGAFLVGADAGRNGRDDRNYFSAAGDLLVQRLRAILGIPTDPHYKSLTQVRS